MLGRAFAIALVLIVANATVAAAAPPRGRGGWLSRTLARRKLNRAVDRAIARDPHLADVRGQRVDHHMRGSVPRNLLASAVGGLTSHVFGGRPSTVITVGISSFIGLTVGDVMSARHRARVETVSHALRSGRPIYVDGALVVPSGDVHRSDTGLMAIPSRRSAQRRSSMRPRAAPDLRSLDRMTLQPYR